MLVSRTEAIESVTFVLWDTVGRVCIKICKNCGNPAEIKRKKIAKTVDRSCKVMMNLLEDPDIYGERNSCGRSLCPTAVIRIADKLHEKLESRRTLGILKNCEHLKRRKFQR